MPEKLKIKDDTIRAIIQPDLDRAVARQEDLSDQRAELLLLYSMSKEAKGIAPLNREGFSQIVAPLCFEAVEGMKVGLDQLFTSPDFFSVKIGKDPEAGERVRKLLRWNIFEAQYGARELRTWLHVTLTGFYGILKVYWDEEYTEEGQEFEALNEQQAAQLLQQGWKFSKFDEVLLQEEVFDEFGNPVVSETLHALENVKATLQVPKFIGPRLQCVDPESFFYSPDSPDLDRCKVVAQRLDRRLEDIKKGELSGKYRKGSYRKCLNIESDYTDVENTDVRNTAIGLSDPTFSDESSLEKYAEPSKRIVVWEIYTSLDIDNDGLLEPVIIHMAGERENGVILNVIENPYKRPPFRLSRAIEAPFLLEGKPYLQSIAQRQIELTAMRRRFQDATAMSVYGSVITNDQQFADAWNNRTVGTAIQSQRVPNDENMRILQPPPPNATILQSIEMVESEAERIGGVTRHSQGITADSLNKTATGMSIINSNTMQKQRYMASVISETYEDVIEDMVACFKLFGEPFIQYFIGKGNEINPADYSSDFTVEIELGVGPQERMQQAAFLKEAMQFAVTVGIPSGFQGAEHVAKIYDRIGDLMGVTMSQYHYSEEEMQQKQQQKAMQQQQMQQQALMQGAMQNVQPQQQAERANNAGSEILTGTQAPGIAQ